jgi:hypothetical protein
VQPRNSAATGPACPDRTSGDVAPTVVAAESDSNTAAAARISFGDAPRGVDQLLAVQDSARICAGALDRRCDPMPDADETNGVARFIVTARPEALTSIHP